MEGLSETQQESVRKMSSERIQGRLMRAGLPEEELMDQLATVMLSGDDPLVSVTSPYTESTGFTCCLEKSNYQ